MCVSFMGSLCIMHLLLAFGYKAAAEFTMSAYRIMTPLAFTLVLFKPCVHYTYCICDILSAVGQENSQRSTG